MRVEETKPTKTHTMNSGCPHHHDVYLKLTVEVEGWVSWKLRYKKREIEGGFGIDSSEVIIVSPCGHTLTLYPHDWKELTT